MSDKKRPSISYLSPIYLQLREIIRTKMEEGEFAPGTAIPSENELAETYGINRMTVRTAVDALVKEGMLTRVQGKGVFVIGEKTEHQLDEMSGFVASFSSNLMKKKTVREFSKEIRSAYDKYATIFNIDSDDPIYSIHQLSISDGIPMSFDEIFIPVNVLPPLDNIASSIFSFLDIFAFYNVRIASIRQSLEIVNSSRKIRKMLEVPDDIAIMRMEFTCYDVSGAAVEFGRSYVRSDKCSFMVHLSD